jgi:hypothetical protein
MYLKISAQDRRSGKGIQPRSHLSGSLLASFNLERRCTACSYFMANEWHRESKSRLDVSMLQGQSFVPSH